MSIDLQDFVRDVPDFPKPGILFKDITPLLQSAAAFRAAIDRLEEICERENLRPDVCAGPEARGFIFGVALAQRLNVGFVPIRKPGKLPSSTHRVEYELEYGTDTVEMHDDAIREGERVLLVDDLLATGGTMSACVDLIRKGGGVVAANLFAIELSFLSGRESLAGLPTFSLLEY